MVLFFGILLVAIVSFILVLPAVIFPFFSCAACNLRHAYTGTMGQKIILKSFWKAAIMLGALIVFFRALYALSCRPAY